MAMFRFLKNQATVRSAAAFIRSQFLADPSWVILIRMFIGLGWIRAAVEKAPKSSWWRGDDIRELAATHTELTLPWFEPVLDGLLKIHPLVVVAVFMGQLVAGIALVTGVRIRSGLFIGMTMNLVFIMVGAVDPSIFYLMLQAVLWLWLFEHHVEFRTSVRSLDILIGLAIVLTIASAPFVQTLDPGSVVEDPAVILATYGLSVAISCWVAKRRLMDA